MLMEYFFLFPEKSQNKIHTISYVSIKKILSVLARNENWTGKWESGPGKWATQKISRDGLWGIMELRDEFLLQNLNVMYQYYFREVYEAGQHYWPVSFGWMKLHFGQVIHNPTHSPLEYSLLIYLMELRRKNMTRKCILYLFIYFTEEEWYKNLCWHLFSVWLLFFSALIWTSLFQQTLSTSGVSVPEVRKQKRFSHLAI